MNNNNGNRSMTGAEYLARVVKGYGISHVFFIDAIARRALVEMESLGIKRILAHTEKAAAYMADGYSRVRKGPAVCMAQSVGASNLASGLQDGYFDQSAIVAITGKKEQSFQYRNAYQELDHVALFNPMTKYSAAVEIKEQLPLLLRQAFREAVTGAPGPVHLDILGHMGQVSDNWEISENVSIDESFKKFPALRPKPEKSQIDRVVSLLNSSHRPVIISGGGSIASGADDEIREIAGRLGIPVVTSLNGKGILEEEHPLNLGVVGIYARSCANKVVSESDLVLIAGSRTGDMVTNNWTIPEQGKPIIQIDINAAEIGRNYTNTIPLNGDIKATISEILDSIDIRDKKNGWADYCSKLVEDWREEMSKLRNSSAVPIRVERLCGELSDFLPEDAILVADTGYSSFWTAVMVYLKHPGQTYIRAAGSLGWSFPASLGAKCAAPDRPVICFTGDGGFWYHLSELETAKRCGINTITIVNNNSGFGQCGPNIRRIQGDTEGNVQELYKFRDVSFARIAEEMGCKGIRVENPESISLALNEALAAGRPVVIEVISDENCRAQS